MSKRHPRTRSAESKQKNACAARGKTATPETRAKMRAAHLVRPKRSWFGKTR